MNSDIQSQMKAQDHVAVLADMEARRVTNPIELNATQESLCKLWAADDRLWTTQETVEFNLRVFARNILKVEERLPLNDVEIVEEPLFGWAKSEAVTIGEILAEYRSIPGKQKQ